MQTLSMMPLMICLLLGSIACQKSSNPDPAPSPETPSPTKTSAAPYALIAAEPEDGVNACVNLSLVGEDGAPIPMIQEVPRLFNRCEHSPQLAPTLAHLTYHHKNTLYLVDIDNETRQQVVTLPPQLDSYEAKWSPHGSRLALVISTDKGARTHLWSWRFKDNALVDMSRHDLSALTDCSSASGRCRVASVWTFEGDDAISYTGSTQDLKPNSHPASGELVDPDTLTKHLIALTSKPATPD